MAKQHQHNIHTSKYRGILLWGQQLGSFDYYIENQQLQAEKDNAPEDALFKRQPPDESWVCVSDLRAEHPFRAQYMDFLEKVGKVAKAN